MAPEGAPGEVHSARGAAGQTAAGASPRGEPSSGAAHPAGARRATRVPVSDTLAPQGRRGARGARARGAPAGSSDAARRARMTQLVRLSFLVLSWCCGRGATQVPAECGNPHTGLLASGEACKGFYAGSHAGFTTACGDGYRRGGGCEVGASFAFGRHDADGNAAIDAHEARGLLAAMGVPGDEMGANFEGVDRNHDGTMTLGEWELAGNMQPPIAMRVTAQSGLDRNFPAQSADFGAQFRSTLGQTYSGMLWIAFPIEGCDTLQGPPGIYTDKMVLMKRGQCEFCVKAKMAQQAGAKAVIVANTDESLVHMTVGSCGQDVTIPSIMIQHSVGTLLENVGHHEPAELVFPTCLDGGTVMPGYGMETCDDGNQDSADGCNPNCVRECGNSAIEGAEACDDGNLNDGDGCSSSCSLEPGFLECSPMGCESRCGDGLAVGGLGGCELGGERTIDKCARFALLPACFR